MSGEEFRIKPNAPGARLDDPDHGGIGQAAGADPTAFVQRENSSL
jgi:hypothetical protein